MAQGLPRTRFNSSGLVRALAELTATETSEARQSFAERLGQWLDFKDSLALYAALNAGAPAAQHAGAAVTERAAARQSFARVRAALAASIATDGLPGPGEAPLESRAPAPPPSAGSAADFAPYHRAYLARQRDMSASIGPLRASVRAALSRRSPAMKRLAGLDAVLEQGLAGRERELLATVPVLLGRRFEQLYGAHQAGPGEVAAADEPAPGRQPGGWLATFRADMQAVLLAELELRLQPVAALIAALDNEMEGGNE